MRMTDDHTAGGALRRGGWAAGVALAGAVLLSSCAASAGTPTVEEPSNRTGQIVWKDTAKDGSAKIHFGVIWYDEDYYRAHRETFKGRFHGHLFAKLGVSADDFTVTHWKKEQDLVEA